MAKQPEPLLVRRPDRKRSFGPWFAVTALAVVFLLLAIGVTSCLQQGARERDSIIYTNPPASEVAEEATRAPEVTVEERLYVTCYDVWDALDRPIFKEDEGYYFDFDLDQDGIGCEDNPYTEEDEAKVNWGAIREKLRQSLVDFNDWSTPKVKQIWEESKEYWGFS